MINVLPCKLPTKKNIKAKQFNQLKKHYLDSPWECHAFPLSEKHLSVDLKSFKYINTHTNN